MFTRPAAARLIIVLFLLAPFGCKSSSSEPPPQATAALDDLLGKINARLALMEEVAGYKHAHKRPIADPEREAALLGKMEKKAPAHGLTAAEVRSFFEAQIEAAKALQGIYLKRWADERRPPRQDLVPLAELRSRIDAVNDQLLAAFAEYRKHPVDADRIHKKAAELLTADGVNDDVRQFAVQPLMNTK